MNTAAASVTNAAAVHDARPSLAVRLGVFAYGVVTYVLFFGAFVYMFGFIGNYLVPRSIDTGPRVPLGEAILINSLLVLAFAVQHTIMARPWFKAWLGRFIPPAAERATFVLAATLLLCLLMWQWRPLGAVVWQTDHPVWRGILMGVSLLGAGLVLFSSCLIDHFDLFGLRQVWLYLRNVPYTHHPFSERSIYRSVRHPLMLGFLIAMWATPVMTTGHLLFALLFTAYIFVGVRFEERDLLRHLGADYAEYRRRTPMLVPRLWQRPQRG